MLLSLLSLVGLASADNEPHARDGSAYAYTNAKNEYLQVPFYTPDTNLTPTAPYRDLVWGDFNVIHTTDTHGWLLGHQKQVWPEANYGGDLGDFASFVEHMNATAQAKGVDLLLVDSGDVHDGTGLSEGFPPGGVDGHDSNKFLLQLPYDLMTIGNHEIEDYKITFDMYKNFVPNMLKRGRYLTSNVYINVSSPDGMTNLTVPVGNRSVTFTTTKGRKVTSLGVIFDFKNHTNITVQPVAEMVKEQWFKDVINANDTDVFVLVGHMPVSDTKPVNDNKWPIVLNAIQHVPHHANTPILIFGGHTHIRDCHRYGGRSMALESGYYMETIGWMSANLTAAKGNANDIAFTRRYMDQNNVTYQYHTNTTYSTFKTDKGRNISDGLNQLAVNFNLSYFYGRAPRTYTWDQSPYPSNGSLLTLFIQEAAPYALKKTNPRINTNNIIITNSMVLRYDVFEGNFTKNDQLTASPYPDKFVYIANVTASVAKQVLPALNKPPGKRSLTDKELWDSGGSMSDWTPGYVTTDNCSSTDLGDDTRHTSIKHYPAPKYISSTPPSVPDSAFIDLVFLDFLKTAVLQALHNVSRITYNITGYANTTTDQVLGIYAQDNWPSPPH